jgi:hypothetical protein
MPEPLSSEILALQTQTGVSLAELCRSKPVLLVFVRHLGCPFCRAVLGILAARREGIEATGVQIAIVHMASESQAAVFFARFDLGDVPRFSDPKKQLYRAFGLGKMPIWELLRTRFWTRGIAMTKKSGIGLPIGDVFQLAGAFVVFQGRVVQAFRTRLYSEIPEI